MRISEMINVYPGVAPKTLYVEVESNYKVPEEGKGQQDAVNFFMGQEHVNAIDSLISVSTSDARKFAQSIIDICDQIEK